MEIRVSQPINCGWHVSNVNTSERVELATADKMWPCRASVPDAMAFDRDPLQIPGTLVVEKFSWIQDSIRIESLFQASVDVTDDVACRLRPPPFFLQTRSVLFR